MKLYYAKGACSLAVRIIIHEIGLKCEFVAVNLGTKQTEHGDDFLKINPKGSVPVLVTDNNEVLTENAVIQQFLADKHHAVHLLPPPGDFRRYRVLEWLNFISSDLHKGCSPLFTSTLPQEVKEKIFIPSIKNKLKLVEEHLNQKKYLMGNDFTLPDSYLFVILSWMPHLKVDISDCKNLNRYFEELKKRDSVQLSLKEEDK